MATQSGFLVFLHTKSILSKPNTKNTSLLQQQPPPPLPPPQKKTNKQKIIT